ncbi:trehalose 6-phosphatase [Spiribacter vilamensis]|uniref:Trehalose 6-phosphate phosphatase n=2 Tax=Spiribacter vilamensis TaxID=531306 RepID=A0A4Q8D2X7_9GAMM|nr:trehalose 6-phosphatase [Spiribacter vilamensis]
MSAAPPITATLPEPRADWALFLDFDGTLVEIAERPDQVVVPARLRPLLGALTEALGGAVAIISGRHLDGLDALLGSTRPALAGLHGLERRSRDGRIHRPPDHGDQLDGLRKAMHAFARQHPGAIVEDKGSALALHYRSDPALEHAARALIEHHCESLGDAFRLQSGKQVLEVGPAGHDKGTVIEAFMTEAPFQGRTPVCLGDDVTDEDAFAAINRLGGHAIRVGTDRPTAAGYELASVNEAYQWLNRLARQLQPRH